MKTLVQVTFLLLVAGFSYGQDIKGQWNGALIVQGNSLPLVFYVTKTDKEYKSTMDSPNQNATGIIVSATTFDSPNVKFEITNLGIVYEGTLAGDQITGKFKQSGRTFDLVLTKAEPK